jgi:hypothetical protein
VLENNGKGPSTSANFLEIMVNDEEAIITKLNHVSNKTQHFL